MNKYLSMRILKSLFVLSVCATFGVSTFAQDVRGYFFNGVYYYTQTSEPYSSDSAMLECYLSGGGVREAEEFVLENGMKTLRRKYSHVISYGGWPEWKTISETTYELQYADVAIYSVSRTSTSSLMPRGTTIKSKITLLALPLENGPRTWEEEEDGTKYSCKAEWAYVVDSDSFFGKVIKISKTEKKSGTVECTYWAYNLGKIWGTVTTDKTRTVSRRSAFKEFKEVSEEEYNKTLAINEFCKEREHVIKSYRIDKPKGYALMQDALDKYVLTLNIDDIVYYAGKSEKSEDWAYWMGAGREWPGFQIRYTFDISVEDYHISCDNSTEETFQNGQKVYADNEMTIDSRVPRAFSSIVFNPDLLPASEVEPTTNYTYVFDMKDQIVSVVDICSYTYKVKKKKDSYEVKSGDMDVWNKCERSVQKKIMELLDRGNGSTKTIRIIKFTCGKYERYALVTDCSVVGYRQEHIRCTLQNTDQRNYKNYHGEYNPNRTIF